MYNCDMTKILFLLMITELGIDPSYFNIDYAKFC